MAVAGWHRVPGRQRVLVVTQAESARKCPSRNTRWYSSKNVFDYLRERTPGRVMPLASREAPLTPLFRRHGRIPSGLSGIRKLGPNQRSPGIAPDFGGTPSGRLRLRRSPGFGEPLPLPPSSLLEAR